ncbi:hypothetical protein J8M51_28300 [Streptomyces scabiei]|nr:hypothetical protein [Streptomyces griseiscabiei]
MLHVVPTATLQNRLLAEAFRVLRPGGVFVGSDSRPTLPFRLLHLGDAMNVLDPGRFRERLTGVDQRGPPGTAHAVLSLSRQRRARARCHR